MLRAEKTAETSGMIKETFVSFCDLFTQQTRANPSAIAVIYNGNSLTYEELDFRSILLANFLRENGVKSESPVALSIHNGMDLLVGILGILRSGGAYLPIDPNYPVERIKTMLEDAKPVLFLTEESLIAKFSFFHDKIALVNSAFPSESINQKTTIQPNQLAYIVFTSGSTGKPKGIMLEHRALTYAALAHQKLHSARLVALMFGSIGFDASLLVITCTLISGGTVCIPKNEITNDPEQIIDLIQKHEINYTLCVPSFYMMLLDKSRELPSLLNIDLGGENMTSVIPDIHLKKAPNAMLYNIYGPSEYAIGAAFAKIYDPTNKEITKITIGKPFPNTQVYILDENLKRTPTNTKGEIFIGGPGLARGYLNNSVLSEEKFIWVSFPDQDPMRLYRTGDYGRFLPDENLEFLGRMDYQVKIRGNRVELGEIEHATCQYQKVKEAAVIVHEEPKGNKHLVTYFTSVDETNITEELKSHLTKLLPKYMIPSAFVQLDFFPRTPNGKIDRNALPPVFQKEQKNIVEPQSTLEKALTEIWKRILHLRVVGTEDNFFDMGGDSLTIASVQTQIEIGLGINVPITVLFQYPTISRLSQYLSQQTSCKISSTIQDQSRRKLHFKGLKQNRTMSENNLENMIAIVGMSGRFPGADNIQSFWDNLCKGKDTISSFSDEELIAAGISKSQVNSPSYVKSRGILNGVELFDADFFGFSAREAELTDPQHRLFLECAWEALENAGYSSDNYAGSIGVYGGTGISSYYLNNIHPNRQLRESLGDFLLRISNDKDFLTTRVSYKLNLKGPSIAVQTACSTSLVAICVACNHLLTYQCDMALAGGISISVPQSNGYAYQEGMILSADGQCRPFDAEAKGTVMSNGAGIVVLKRLQDALADKDHIFAVIRGYGINNDGSAKIGYSAPSIEGQAESIASAIAMADIDSETIAYAEAHGTGTILGDPIEIQGLTNAFHSTKKEYCAIGSVKSNIGHTVEAAGVIGLIKVALSLYHRKIPPSLYYHTPNPHIDFKETPFYVNKTLKEWETVEHPRRACISSFGIGGTNAHAIIEEWLQSIHCESLEGLYPLVLSAKTLTALKIMAYNLGQHLQEHPEFSLADVAYTLLIGRKSFEHKRVLTYHNREEAISLLLDFDHTKYADTSAQLAEDVFKDKHCRRVPLPTYPFEKKRYWIDAPTATNESTTTTVQSNSIEITLTTIWKKFLGSASIGIHDDFFQLGGDSLLAIQVADNISKQFNLNIGMQTLFSYPTIDKLSKLISEQKPLISPIVKLKSGSTNNPLFLIHPIEGNLFCYKDLIDALTCPNPLYGIQAVDTEPKSIEVIASSYIKELRKVQPEGPYHLLGLSFGGIIAYEMARQLEASNDNISLLCMLDVGRPDLVTPASEKELLVYLVELLEGKPAFDTEITLEKIIHSLGLGTLPLKEQERIFHLVKAHLQALTDYHPKPFGGKILFCQATQRFFRNKDVCLGSSWKELVSHRIEILEVSGNHMSILKQPQISKLANFLNAYLEKENSTQSTLK